MQTAERGLLVTPQARRRLRRTVGATRAVAASDDLVVAHDGRVEIRVADAGPGIPEELREAVFERYQCGAVRTSMSRGLGLTFCKLAVEAHGGHLWIEDASPGTTFCLSVPSTGVPSPGFA